MRSFFVSIVATIVFVSSAFAAEGAMTMKEPAATASGQLIGIGKVADYAKWRAAFDADEENRKGSELTNARVYQSKDNPNEVVVMLDMADVKKAKEFTSSKKLKAIMKKSGVKNVHFWYVNAAQ